MFSLDDDPGATATVSMFIRTRQPSGLLLVLANSTSQYLRLWLEEGRVKVQINTFETFASRGQVSDGQFHLLSLRVESAQSSLLLSAQNQGSLPTRPIRAQNGDQVFVGGLPDSRASAMFGGYFKGCVQDLRINSKRLQFFPIPPPVESYRLERLAGVAQGCGGDDACTVSLPPASQPFPPSPRLRRPCYFFLSSGHALSQRRSVFLHVGRLHLQLPPQHGGTALPGGEMVRFVSVPRRHLVPAALSGLRM